jgi:hypothetical protein
VNTCGADLPLFEQNLSENACFAPQVFVRNKKRNPFSLGEKVPAGRMRDALSVESD